MHCRFCHPYIGPRYLVSYFSYHYSICLLILQLSIHTKRNWTWVISLGYWGSLLVFFCSSMIYDNVTGDLFGVWQRLLVSPTFWLTFLIAISFCVLPCLAFQGYQENFLEFKSDPVHILRRAKLFTKVADSSSQQRK